MNLGADRDQALKLALAEAKKDGRTRWVHFTGQVYWCDTTALTGIYAPEQMIVYPFGQYETYDTSIGGENSVNADRPGDQTATGDGQHPH